jgi:dipeptidase D
VIHAGLECGIVKQKAPDMEIITCGANARNIHSPAEALELASFERFFGILSDMLANL